MAHARSDFVETLDMRIDATSDPAEKCRLRVHRNALTPLGRLPDEILRHVLEFVVRFCHEGFTGSPADIAYQPWYEVGYSIGWVSVMGVCSHIRSQMIESHSFWTYIDMDRQRPWVQLCLERCGSLPLSLAFGGKKHGPQNMQLLRALVPRAHDLRCSLIYAPLELHILIRDLLNQSLPHLRVLAHEAGAHGGLNLSPAFLRSNKVPNLVILRVDQVNIKESNLSFPALRFLHFGAAYVDGRAETLLRLLEGSPLIEDIEIIKISFANPPDGLYMRPLHLPHLSRVDITAPLPWVSILSRSLPTPKKAYYLSVMKGDPEYPQVVQDPLEAASIRALVFDQVLCILGPSTGPSLRPPAYVEKKRYGYKITIDVRPSDPGSMHVLYEDCCQTLDGLRCLLDHVQVEMSKDDSDSETDSEEEMDSEEDTDLEEETDSDEVEMNSGEEEMNSGEETDSDEFAEDQDDEDDHTESDANYQPKFVTSALRTSRRNIQPQ
jgi:hypothetical protein